MSTLIADIGGTNGRFALLDGAAYTPPVSLPLSGFTGIAAAIAHVLGDRPPPPAAVLAVAGPVQHNRVTLTNRSWVVDGTEIAAALGIGRVRVVNDFAALSSSLPHLAGADLYPLGGGDHPARTVIGRVKSAAASSARCTVACRAGPRARLVRCAYR